ncbi:MAG: hypothetical protein AB7K24_04970 [Gemmataceae bacterium]
MSEPSSDLESDPRFPSGPWTGFFLQKEWPGRHMMEMQLTFKEGSFTGEGRDAIGPFRMRGRYSSVDGTCYWTKRYLGRHDVFYKGYNEGKGIWGVWQIGTSMRGGFHIWPEGMPDPTQPTLHAAAEPPIEFDNLFDESPEEVPIRINR